MMSTTRPGRFGDGPAQWLLEIARRRGDGIFDLIDLRDFPMPFFEEETALVYAPASNPIAQRFARTMASYDAYIFITAEYNHGIPAVLKNALDYLYTEVHRKPAAFLGYGGVGASRAIEHLRHVLAELHVATIKHSVHINANEMIGMLRQGKNFADFPYLDEAANLMPVPPPMQFRRDP